MSDAGALKVQFQFDFGSPNAYLAARVIPESSGGLDKVRLCAGAARRHLQAHRQQFARRLPQGRQEQARLHGAGDSALHQASRHHHLRRNPFFPVNTLQLMRGAVAAEAEGAFLAVFPGGLSPHVGRAEEDGRSWCDARSAHVLGDRCRQDHRPIAGPGRQEPVDGADAGSGRSRRLRLSDFFVNNEMFFGKDQLRDVEEEILAQKRAMENSGPPKSRRAS